MIRSEPKISANDLLAFLVPDLDSEAAREVGRLVTDSRRFESFAARFRTKIRKKLRTATSSESLRSVLLELRVASRFLSDRRCSVVYELKRQDGARSPDLTVTI